MVLDFPVRLLLRASDLDSSRPKGDGYLCQNCCLLWSAILILGPFDGETGNLPLRITLSVDHLTNQQANNPVKTVVMPKTIAVMVSGVTVARPRAVSLALASV